MKEPCSLVMKGQPSGLQFGAFVVILRQQILSDNGKYPKTQEIKEKLNNRHGGTHKAQVHSNAVGRTAGSGAVLRWAVCGH